MLTDILIGGIIGIALERATKISFAAQKAIKQFKENKRKEQVRKQALVNEQEVKKDAP